LRKLQFFFFRLWSYVGWRGLPAVGKPAIHIAITQPKGYVAPVAPVARPVGDQWPVARPVGDQWPVARPVGL
jgi:hypothetical protein